MNHLLFTLLDAVPATQGQQPSMILHDSSAKQKAERNSEVPQRPTDRTKRHHDRRHTRHHQNNRRHQQHCAT